MNRNTNYCDIIGLLRGEGEEITRRGKVDDDSMDGGRGGTGERISSTDLVLGGLLQTDRVGKSARVRDGTESGKR